MAAHLSFYCHDEWLRGLTGSVAQFRQLVVMRLLRLRPWESGCRQVGVWCPGSPRGCLPHEPVPVHLQL
jgi:hypothetical protein